MTGKQYSRASVILVFRSRWLPSLSVGQLISGMERVLIITAASILVFRINDSLLKVGLILVSSPGLSIFVGLLTGIILEPTNHSRIILNPLTPIQNPFKIFHKHAGTTEQSRTSTWGFAL